jgi:hypothetical protein
MQEFDEYSPEQLFGIARNCFEENCKAALRKDNVSFNLNRGLLALVSAVERQLQHIRSDVGRIPR